MIPSLHGVASFPLTDSGGVLSPSPSGDYVPHRYWRLSFEMFGSNLALSEINFYEIAGGSAYNRSGVTAAAQSTYDVFAAANVLDGNASTFWHSNGGAPNQWLSFDMGTPVAFQEMSVRGRDSYQQSQGPTEVQIEYSDNGISWTDLGEPIALGPFTDSVVLVDVFEVPPQEDEGGGGPVVLWTPLAETSLRLFLHGDDLAGADGDPVTAWVDRSPAGNDATSIVNPAVAAAVINGYNALATDPGVMSLPDFFTGATEMSVLIIAKSPGGATGGPLLASSAGSSAAHHPYFSDMYDHFGSNTRYGFALAGVDVTDWYMAHFHAQASNWKAFLNGVQKHSNTSNTIGWTSSPRIGQGYFIDGSQMFNGQIAAVIVFEDIDDLLRWKVEGWAAWEFGMEAGLPVDHPYKVGPPMTDGSVGTP